jgi:cell division protein FtsZ
MIDFAQESSEKDGMIAKIKVIGVGGAGGNTVNSIIESGYQGIEFIAANTDAQALDFSRAKHKIQLGVKSTKGLGTGANPEVGKRAAEEDLDKIIEVTKDADIVFLTAGMGGGTGSGSIPVIARALKERGILTIAIVTKPFLFEGKRRALIAQEALRALQKEVDTLIVMPNQKLLEIVDQEVSMIDAFAMINEVLSLSVKGISDIISRPGHINVDFADVKTIMQSRGIAVMGTAKASGVGRAEEAALRAISSPLLENMSIEGARGVLLNITGGKSLSLHEVSQAACVVYKQAHEDAHIIIGSVIDESMQDEVSVTVIATGFDREQPKESPDVEVAAHTRVKATVQAKPQEVNEPVAVTPKTNSEVVVDRESQSKKPHVIAKELTATQQLYKDDLDVPTFLRKEIQSHVE